MIVQVEIPDEKVEELKQAEANGEYVGQMYDDLCESIGAQALRKAGL